MAKRTTPPAAPATNAGADTAEQTSAGRPPGSPNRAYAAVKVLPPACPHCDGTEFEKRQQTVTRELSGNIEGRVYNRVQWSKACCKGCGQWVSFREFRLVDE